MANVLKVEIDGMKCDGCAQKITTAIRDLPHVSHVHVSHQPPEARVTIDSNDAVAAIMQAIAGSGFAIRAYAMTTVDSAES